MSVKNNSNNTSGDVRITSVQSSIKSFNTIKKHNSCVIFNDPKNNDIRLEKANRTD